MSFMMWQNNRYGISHLSSLTNTFLASFSMDEDCSHICNKSNEYCVPVSKLDVERCTNGLKWYILF